jgi:DNA transformation protein and related proteins
MAVSKDFISYVIEQLSPFTRVTSRRMFGGVGLYANDLFFGLIASDTLYFKVDGSNRADYEQRGSKPFCPFPDKSDFSMSYYDLPADLLEDADELSRWARKSVAVALAAASMKARKKVIREAKKTSKKKR